MLKLYKQSDNGIFYWETWEKDNKTGIIHWGEVGKYGQEKEIKSRLLSNFRKEIQKEINKVIAEGFQEIDIEDHFILIIEFQVDGMGDHQDIEKRYRLQDRMDNTLGWTGLGHCDGGSIGSGTMEVCCFVIDFEIARKVIEKDLKDTEFADFKRIFDERNV